MSSTQGRASPGGAGWLGGRRVARIGFGALQVSGRWYGIGDHAAPSPRAATAVLRRAVALGVNHIDTAHYYGDGMANHRIRSALAPYPDDLVLATKIGAAENQAGRLCPAQRPEQLRAAVEANLRSLGVECLSIVYLRRLDVPPGQIAEGEQVVDLDSQLAELTALRDEGKIAAIGLSNVSLEQLCRGLPAGLACVENVYNVLERAAEPLLELCAAEGLAWVPFFALGSPFAGETRVSAHPTVRSIALRLEATAVQVALAWLLARAPHILLIPGTTSLIHLQENVAAGSLTLDAAALAELDTVT